MLSPNATHRDFRMKWISTCKTQFKHLGGDEEFLKPPVHVIDPSLFVVGWNPFAAPPSKDDKQSSIVIIFSVWKTMVGSAVTCLPLSF